MRPTAGMITPAEKMPSSGFQRVIVHPQISRPPSMRIKANAIALAVTTLISNQQWSERMQLKTGKTAKMI